MPTITKSELADTLAEKVGLSPRDAKEIVRAFFVEISNVLETGEEVKLSNFGNFTTRDKAARPGRNPKTGLEAEIAARRVVTFHPSAKLKIAVSSPQE